ncbi:MAG: IMP cyclohydrolase [Eubacteriales bacterium]
MTPSSISQLLRNNSYPGRGIIIGMTGDAQSAVVAYFIMGRSDNSRNRIFEEQTGGIRTKAFDESKLTDPSLIIYNPIRTYKGDIIVTNGDQTDTVYYFLSQNLSFEDALRSRTFEPDPPNFTPRISGLLSFSDSFSYKLSILKSADGCPDGAQRFFYEYLTPLAGEGRFIHTYQSDGSPLPSFEGEPRRVVLDGDIDMLTSQIWDNLNDENKVSLYVCYKNIEDGTSVTRIINKLEK